MLKWLVKFGGYTTILRVVAMISTLAFVSILSQWMGKEDYGLLAMLISLTTLAATVGGFGQSERLIREMSPALEKGETGHAQGLLALASHRVTLVSILVALLVGGYFALTGSGVAVSLAAAIIVIALSLNLAWSGAARAHNRFLLAMGPKDIFWRVFSVIAIGLALLVGTPASAANVSVIMTLVLVATVGIQAAQLGIGLPDLLRKNAGDKQPWLAECWHLTLLTTAIAAQNTVDVFLVGALMSPSAAAEYFPANRIALVAGFFTLPFDMVIAPRVAQLMRKGDLDGVKQLQSYATALLSLASIGISIILIAGYGYYEAAFSTSSDATRLAVAILVGGQAVGALAGMPNVVMIMAKREKVLARVNVAFMVIGIVTIAMAAMLGTIVTVAWAVTINILLRRLAVAVITAVLTGVLPIHPGLMFSRSTT